MEELGIGRPSTYTAILTVLRERGYVRQEGKKRLIPEDKGRLVTAFLESFFSRYVEYDFTANLEEQLDRISSGEIDWKAGAARFLARFHRRARRASRTCASPKSSTPSTTCWRRISSRPARTARRSAHLPDLRKPAHLSLKLGKFGAFIGCSNYPECRYTRQLGSSGDGEDKKLDSGRRQAARR